MNIPNMLQADLPRKLVAFFFALLIWFTVRSQLQDYDIFHSVPVTIRDNSGTMEVKDNVITVDVTLRGSRNSLQKVQPADIKLNATVPDIPKGVFSTEINLSKAEATTPTGTRVVDIVPKSVVISVDRIVTKHNVPIRVRYAGQLPEGFRIARCSLFPSAVDIRGPSKLLLDIHELVTEPIQLDETLNHDFEIDVKLVPPPSIHTSTSSIHAAVELTRHSTQKSYETLALQLLNRVGSTLQPQDGLPSVSVTLNGPKVILDELGPGAIKPFVDLTTITSPGTYRRPVQVWVDGAPNVTAEYVSPSVIEVQLVDRRAPTPPPDTKQNAAAPPPAASN